MTLPEPGAGDAVALRAVAAADLPLFFAHQRDAEAVRMAAFPPRDRAAFDAHWARILGDPAVVARTVLFRGRVAGYVVSWAQDGRREVGYWLGREAWGHGVASRALAAFLRLETTRPLDAHVARHNLASRRVLEKCGFTVHREARVPLGSGGDAVEELVMRLGTGPPPAAAVAGGPGGTPRRGRRSP
jgi:RimJ/RimL family protein N-acetyltransferase